jgi:hypothetical protein
MNTTHELQRSWSTSSYGGLPTVSQPEEATSRVNVEMCSGSWSRFSTLQCVAEATHGFIAARFVTTLVVVMLISSVFSLWL